MYVKNINKKLDSNELSINIGLRVMLNIKWIN